MDETNIGIIILAAGASSRLGKPKQLVKFQYKTLISRTIETAIQTRCKDIIVVLGSNTESVKEEIKNFPVQICINNNWQNGMASSIKCGLEELLATHSKLNAAIIMLCDQPFIESKHIDLLIETFTHSKKPIIAAKYKNIAGVPAFFSCEVFDELLKMKGDKGARKIIAENPDLVQTVAIVEAEFAIDTPEDIKKLNKKTDYN